MKKRILLILAILLLFISIATVNAEVNTNIGDINPKNYKNINHPLNDIKEINKHFTLSSKSKNASENKVIISGKITHCNDSTPFEGAKILVKSLEGKTVAKTISDSKGKYKVMFRSFHKTFIVQATYPGHVYPSKKITLSGKKKIKFGRANFKLGDLSVKICSSVIAVSDSKNSNPDTHLIHLKVTNDGTTTANDLWLKFSWNGTEHVNFTLSSTGENPSKFIGDVNPGETVDVFFLVGIPHETPSEKHSANYTININGTNIASMNISGHIRSVSESADSSTDITFKSGTSLTHVGSQVNFTLGYHINGAEPWFSPFISYDPRVLKLISVVTTNGTHSINSSFVNRSLLGGNDYTTTWIFEAIDDGLVDVFAGIFGGNVQGDGTLAVLHFSNSINNPIELFVRKTLDLAITKEVNNSNPSFGENISYIINVTNNGPSNGTNVVVRDILPVGLIFVSANQTTYNSVSGEWNIAILEEGKTISLSIVATVNRTGLITNNASAYSFEYDTNLSNNHAGVTIYVSSVDLTIKKVVNDKHPNYGDNITYTITVTNNGPDKAIGVLVSDVLPNGLIFLDTDGTYNPTDRTITWIIGDLDVNEIKTFFINVTVDTTVTTTNIANVTGDIYEGDLSNNYGSATIAIPIVDLEITKEVNNRTPYYKDNITYTINVSNIGQEKATGITVSDILPEGLIFINASNGTFNCKYNPITREIIWIIGELAVGEKLTLSINVTVNKTGTITNNVKVSSREHDDNPNDNFDSVTINVPHVADISVEKTVDKNTPNLNEEVTFTIVVSNNGPDKATEVKVTDILPEGLVFVHASSSYSFNYDPISRKITWTINDLNQGQFITLTIKVLINKTGNIINNANALALQYDPDLLNNHDNVTLRVIDSRTFNNNVDLAIKKSVNNSNPKLGDKITYTIIVTNNGPANATGVKVIDILPEGLVFLSASESSYNPISGFWLIGNLINGETITLYIIVTVNKTGTIRNIAFATGNQQDSNNPNPNSSVTITVANRHEESSINHDTINTPNRTDDEKDPDPIDPLNTDEPADEKLNNVSQDPNHHSIPLKKTALPIAMLLFVFLAFWILLPLNLKDKK